MKKLAFLALCAASTTLHAQNLSDQDVNLLTASSGAMTAYQSGGMTGIYNKVNQCYANLRKRPANPAKDVEFCIALDMSGLFIDYYASQAGGFPRNERFMDNVASSRMHGVLLKTGLSKNPADTQIYLDSRNERVSKYVLAAMSLPNDASPSQKSKNACIQKEMARWEKKRDRDNAIWCAELAKKGQECRVSAGQEALVEEEAMEQAAKKCS